MASKARRPLEPPVDALAIVVCMAQVLWGLSVLEGGRDPQRAIVPRMTDILAALLALSH